MFDAARDLVEGADADVEFHTVAVAGDPARNVVDYAERTGSTASCSAPTAGRGSPGSCSAGPPNWWSSARTRS